MSPTSLATTRGDHILHNLAQVRRRVGRRLVLAAVKANAYGHGAVALARLIEAEGAADWLGVSQASEGLELRRAGVGLPVLILSPAGEDELPAAIAAGLTLTVTDEASVAQASRAATALGATAAVHLKVDTGMGRIGLPPDQAPRLAALARDAPGVGLTGVFSHLPAADDPAQDDFTAAQIKRFAAAARAVEQVVGPVVKHLANSAAVLAHPDSWFDLVRPGIMLYGADPSPDRPCPVDLRPGLEWTSRVSFLKLLPAGQTVGYGRTWTARRDSWIATLPVGYGDGYSRLLSNRGRALIRGRSYAIAGRICMDQLMVDLGPTTDVAVGDRATLIGRDGPDEITTAELARLMDTIPYEVTCLIAPRVGRAVVGLESGMAQLASTPPSQPATFVATSRLP
ncbi:MAG: alanine racemase [Propionibacteriaceae bacterium]|jgi:alanine racemase|nr:alanine racemase [Propionibacteriaceae bacterium]